MKKAIARLYETLKKLLNQIEEIENTISKGQPYAKTTIVSKKKLITQNLMFKK